MILSNTEILKALNGGYLDISPRPSTGSLNNPHSAYDTTSVNLKLGKIISTPEPGSPFNFDLEKGKLAPFLKSICKRFTLEKDQAFTLRPHQLILGQTLEKIHLPIINGKPVLAARVEGRSSVARCGVLVHFTAPTIHAGFEGTITLEIINLGHYDFTLRAGMEICQLVFELVSGVPDENPSQFNQQTTPEGTID